jgi:hypothetical protein
MRPPLPENTQQASQDVVIEHLINCTVEYSTFAREAMAKHMWAWKQIGSSTRTADDVFAI